MRENLTLIVSSVKRVVLNFLRDIRTVNVEKVASLVRQRYEKRLDVDN